MSQWRLWRWKDFVWLCFRIINITKMTVLTKLRYNSVESCFFPDLKTLKIHVKHKGHCLSYFSPSLMLRQIPDTQHERRKGFFLIVLGISILTQLTPRQHDMVGQLLIAVANSTPSFRPYILCCLHPYVSVALTPNEY